MSELMRNAIIGMPYEMAMGDELSRRQFYSRAQDLLQEVQELEAKLAELQTETKFHIHSGKTAGDYLHEDSETKKFMNTKDLIQSAVDKFLAWKLPKHFGPDHHVSFDRSHCDYEKPGYWPTGTNLLTADQAREMFEHCLADAAPQQREPLTGKQIADLHRDAYTAGKAFTTLEVYTCFARAIEAAHGIGGKK